jgi:hypothetical protein
MSQTIKEKVRCEALTRAGVRCKRETIKHAKFCFQHAKEILGIQVKPSMVQNAGNGLFAARPLPEGTRIQYARPEDALTIQQVISRYGERGRGDYVVCNRTRCLDARSTQSGHGRYVNDPRGTRKKANSKLTVYQQNGQTKGNIRLTKKVKQGEEILTRYGGDYWRL